jgi:hypothetical protein
VEGLAQELFLGRSNHTPWGGVGGLFPFLWIAHLTAKSFRISSASFSRASPTTIASWATLPRPGTTCWATGRRRDCGRPVAVMPGHHGRAQGRTVWAQLLVPGCSLRRGWWTQFVTATGAMPVAGSDSFPAVYTATEPIMRTNGRGARFKVGTCCRVWTDGLSARYGVPARPPGITAPGNGCTPSTTSWVSSRMGGRAKQLA